MWARLFPADVTTVVLNYRGGGDTADCLRALYTMPDRPGRVIVIDNDSRDRSCEYILEIWQTMATPEKVPKKTPLQSSLTEAVLLRLCENGGYSSGNNAGIRLALRDPGCRAVWILNNDTEPAAGALEALCRRLNDVPEAGLAGSTLVYAHAKDVVQCAGGFVLNRLTGATPAVHGGEPLECVTKLPTEAVEKKVTYLCGASMLVRREVFASAGFLPEEYFLYYEDAAFCLNAQKAGYRLAWAPDSIVFHKEGGSTGAKSADAGRRLKRSRLMDYLALRNRIYIVRRYFPSCLSVAVASYAGVMVNRLRRGQIRRLPLVLRALMDGVRGRMGKPESPAAGKEMQHILFLTLRADFGGGPEHLWQLIRHAPPSVTLHVACPEDYPYYGRYRDIVGEANIFQLPHRLFSLRKLWRLRHFCLSRDISVLHSHGKGAGLYARLLAILTGLPCVHTFHGVHMDGYKPVKRYVYRLYEHFMSLFTRVGIAVSEGEKAQIISEGLMPASKLRLVSNGVSIPEQKEHEDGPLSLPYTVVTLSRFDYQKNSVFFLDIARALDAKGRLGEFQFILVGDGADRQAVLRAAQSSGWKNCILCPGASEQPHKFFGGALCYLSTSRWEGMPLAVLEAMAHGLPVVASDVVGNNDAVCQGVSGFLYPEGDAAAAATALCRLVDDPGLRRSMGGNARTYVLRHHSVEEMAAKTFEVLKDVGR